MHRDSGLIAQMCLILELIQTLKKVFSVTFNSKLCAHMRAIVTFSFAVFARQSRYHRRGPLHFEKT